MASLKDALEGFAEENGLDIRDVAALAIGYLHELKESDRSVFNEKYVRDRGYQNVEYRIQDKAVPENYYCVHDLLNEWGCGKTFLYRALESGQLKGIRVGRAWRVSDKEKQRFEKEMTEKRKSHSSAKE